MSDTDQKEDMHNLLVTLLALNLNVPDGLWEAGYRLDPYPNGKTKDELVAIIDARDVEIARNRNFMFGLIRDLREGPVKCAAKINAYLGETSRVTL